MVFDTTFLRPPGVTTEEDFQKRCISCGQCAQVCNFKCIVMLPDRLLVSGETPRVYARSNPCFLCMKCSDICPTDALRTVSRQQAGMGKAVMNLKTCVDYQEEKAIMCWTCYERCPLKGSAIILQYGYTPTITDACVGCGVCEYVCPVKAITTTPTRKLSTEC